MMKITGYLFTVLLGVACTRPNEVATADTDTPIVHTNIVKPVLPTESQEVSSKAETSAEYTYKTIPGTKSHELVAFAKTLIGIPYKYASTDPAVGFDCSGFITYVFNHFNIAVPRSSVDFTNVGKDIKMENAKEGDLILFTGTVDSIRIVGHMGIVTENSDTLKFIHSTSGKANGVTITPFTDHYQKRFVKVIRVLPD